jgi:lambda family phage tail tape measure protein
LGITAGIANLIGKSPVGLFAKLIAAGATTAAGAAAVLALEELMSANEGVQATAEEAAKAQGKLQQTNPSADPAKRKVTVPVNPEAQAILDSERRIQQAKSDITRLGESRLYDEIANIRAKANADLTKMEAEVNSQRLLNSTQKEREIAERRIAINADADFQIVKYRTEQEKKLADQLSGLALSTKERRDAFELEQKLLGVTGQQADIERARAEINKERARALRDLDLDKTLSPEQLERQRKALNEQYDAQVATAEAQVDFQRQFETGWSRAFQSYMDNATNAATQAQAMFQAMTNGMNSALDAFVDSGKFSFSDLTNSIIKDIIKIQLRAAAARLFSAGSNFLGFSIPGRAVGGPVMANTPYMIGERGPELFIPAQAGNIMANDKLNKLGGGAATSNITYNIQAVDAMSFKQMVARDPSFLYAVTEQGRKTIPSTRR